MNFELVFDAGKTGYQWWFPAIGLIAVALSFGMLVWHRKNPSPLRSRGTRIFPYLAIGFTALWTTTIFAGTFFEYWYLRRALNNGDFEVVEGKVVGFVPMPKEGHARERFTVNGHTYEYSDFHPSASFNNTRSHDGPIREGIVVRIADVQGKIARLEIARQAAGQ